MNRTDRLVAMVMHLQGRRVVRAEELAAQFEISVRTVYRDIAALSESGVPIAGEPGVGYSLMKSFHLPPVMLTVEEAGALFTGGEMVRQFTDPSLHVPMASALLKLRAVLPRDRQEHVERLARNTVVMGAVKCAEADWRTRPWLLDVQRAVVQRQVLRIDYRARGRGENLEREVEPLGVVFYGGSWYLVAWCRLRHDLRHFRLDRMASVRLSRETFAARPDFSLAEHLRETVSASDTIAVRVWFSDAATARARRESFAGLIEEKAAEGGAVFSFYTFSLEWMARWLLSFGADAEALEPPRLRALVQKEAGDVARRYETARGGRRFERPAKKIAEPAGVS